MTDSIFTKIIKGAIPSHKLYEDEQTFAFLDIHPIQPGHTLVVPKRQVEFVWDLEPDEYQALMATVQKLAQHLRNQLGKPYVGSKIFGIDVPHAHVHLIPFSTAAEFNHRQAMDAQPDHEALAALARRLAL